jgi:CoA:oxalate CoA-transferase
VLDVLSGVTIVDLTSNVAGPFATMVLADLGATVWKVEPPGVGDVTRRWPPFAPDGTSTVFLALNRGKRSVALDLKDETGRRALLALVARADVLVSSLRPGSLARLGLGPDVLAEHNPSLICSDISAYVGLCDRGNQPGFDAVIQAYTGLMDLTGYPDQPPARVGTGIVDFGTGMWTALGVVSALLRRERGGPDRAEGAGQQVSATLFGTAVGFLVHHLAAVEFAGASPSRIGTAQHNSAPYEALATVDGMVLVGVTSEPLWLRFCAAIEAPELTADPNYTGNDRRVANRAVLHAQLERYTGRLTVDALVARLEEFGVPCSPVRSVADLAADPQLAASGLWQPTVHGGNAAATPLRFDGSAATVGELAPSLGSDTETTLTAAGLPAADVDQLLARAGIAGNQPGRRTEPTREGAT